MSVIKQIRSVISLNRKKSTYVNKLTDTELFMQMATPSCMELAFKGSESIMDWVINFLFWPFPLKQKSDYVYWVHGGFWKKYKSVKEKIYKFIHAHNPKTIIITGLSQGGAIAQLAHRDLINIFPNIFIKTITVASPRVFLVWNKKKISKDLQNIDNILYTRDLVPYLPLKLQGFFTTGATIKIGGHKWIKNPFSHNYYYHL